MFSPMKTNVTTIPISLSRPAHPFFYGLFFFPSYALSILTLSILRLLILNRGYLFNSKVCSREHQGSLPCAYSRTNAIDNSIAALWPRIIEKPDCSTCPFTSSVAPLTRSLAPHHLLRSCAPLRSLARSLAHFAHSLAVHSVFFSVLAHSVIRIGLVCD